MQDQNESMKCSGLGHMRPNVCFQNYSHFTAVTSRCQKRMTFAVWDRLFDFKLIWYGLSCITTDLESEGVPVLDWIQANSLMPQMCRNAHECRNESNLQPECHIAQTLRSMSIKYQSNTFVSGRHLIDINPMAFAIWDGIDADSIGMILGHHVYWYVSQVCRVLFIISCKNSKANREKTMVVLRSPNPFECWILLCLQIYSHFLPFANGWVDHVVKSFSYRRQGIYHPV